MNLECDVVVVGGGLVGMSLCLALAEQKRWCVVSVEAQASVIPSVAWDERHFALGRATWTALSRLGVDFSGVGALIRSIHVSRQGALGRLLLRAADHDVEAFGRVVPARLLVQGLLRKYLTLDDVVRLEHTRALATQVDSEGITLSTESASGAGQIRARLLIAADGAASPLRQHWGIASEGCDYGQTALVGVVETGRPLNEQAYERFTDSGPLALLPIDASRAGLVLSLPTDRAEGLLSAGEHAIREELGARFGQRLGKFGRVGRLQAWPLRLNVAERITAPRAILVGNAAQAIHPIAAQGFNLGFRDAASVAQQLSARPQDLGSPDWLADYATRRAPDRARTIAFSHGLARLMASALPINPLRSLALFGAGLPELRQQLVRSAMGYAA